MESWGRKRIKRFKKVYDKAYTSGKETFIFEGRKVFVPYAKFLIEYLEGRVNVKD